MKHGESIVDSLGAEVDRIEKLIKVRLLLFLFIFLDYVVENIWSLILSLYNKLGSFWYYLENFLVGFGFKVKGPSSDIFFL